MAERSSVRTGAEVPPPAPLAPTGVRAPDAAPPSAPPAAWRRASFLPIPLLAVLMAATYLAVDPRVFWDPGWLILAGNGAFVTGVGLAVAWMSLRAFSASGRLQVLLLGCGVLAFGVGAALAAAARSFPDGANLNVTIYNVAALQGGAFHAVAGLLLVSGRGPELGPARRRTWLWVGLAWAVASMAVVAAAASRGLLPPFFVQGVGPTAVRQRVLGAADLLFLFALASAAGTFVRTQERFLYWYAGALALTAISLTGFFIQHSVGSPVGWIARTAQYVGGAYFLVSLLTVARAAQRRGTSPESELASALSGAEEKFRALADNAPDVIRRFDRNLDHIYVNVAGQRLYGRSAGALLGHGMGVVGIPDAQAGAWTERIRRVFETGAPEQVEEFVDGPDGRRFYESLCVPEHGADGAVANVLVLSRDLTDRRRAEERTRRQNAVLEGIARVFRETLGAETEEELGRTCLDVAQQVTGSALGFLGELNARAGRLDDLAISDPGWAACRMREQGGHDRRLPAGLAVHGLYGRVVTEGRSLVANDPGAHPDRVGTPPGHPALESFLGVPLLRDGKVVGMIGLANRPGGFADEDREAAELLAPAVVQALERKRAANALRDASAFAQALNVVGQLIHSTRDLDEIMRSALTAAVAALGATSAAVSMREAGRWVVRWVHGLPPATVGAAMRDEDERHAVLALERREPVAIDDALHDERVDPARMAAWGIRSVLVIPLVFRGAPLGVCFINFQEAPVTFTPSHLDFAVKLGSAVSVAVENARLVADLQEAARRKDEFLGMLSHELRNPLAPIRNSVFLLEHAAPSSDTARRAGEVIRRQTDHLTRLVDELLDVTRIARGKIELQRRRVDLRELVRRACDDHRTLFQNHGIDASVEVPAEALWVDADETRILQVMGNLLQNAARFGREHGAVTVAAGTEGGSAWIRVRDDGAGISPEFLPRVFEPFVQEERGLARSKGGLGLGLALVKGLVELHGGTVSARSDGVGKGAELLVRLPLAGGPRAERATAAPPPAPVASGGRRILVVDDNPDEATTLGDALSIVGYRVAIAHDGEDALAQVRTFRPSVVLCDIGLPRMNGFEVARAIRRDPALAGVHLVALTGYARPEDVAATREAGFDHHLAKPATIPDIERVMSAPPAEGGAAAHPGSAGPPRGPVAPVASTPGPGDDAARARALEAFISRALHDARAPFRQIDGFCAALLDDFAASLGEEGKRQVSQIRLARTRAQELVEDLLTLWRVANVELTVADVDLTTLAREVCAGLTRRDPERRVELEIEEGVTARGDPRLLRIVLEQLLGNAWKFTARRPATHVTFGRTDTTGGPALRVRDDGPGFDPGYATTLFEPFQRLHSLSEYEGTGLGLHIVRRAVERHGGRAWIESAPGGGTTVYFTLG